MAITLVRASKEKGLNEKAEEVKCTCPDSRWKFSVKLWNKCHAKCYEIIRKLRWPEGINCPQCGSSCYKKRGFHEKQPARQRYECKSCNASFDDLTNTPLAGHRQPLKVWILCLYFMGLNLSNQQISNELDLARSDVQEMTTQLRESIFARRQVEKLEKEVEFDEVLEVVNIFINCLRLITDLNMLVLKQRAFLSKISNFKSS